MKNKSKKITALLTVGALLASSTVANFGDNSAKFNVWAEGHTQLKYESHARVEELKEKLDFIKCILRRRESIQENEKFKYILNYVWTQMVILFYPSVDPHSPSDFTINGVIRILEASTQPSHSLKRQSVLNAMEKKMGENEYTYQFLNTLVTYCLHRPHDDIFGRSGWANKLNGFTEENNLIISSLTGVSERQKEEKYILETAKFRAKLCMYCEKEELLIDVLINVFKNYFESSDGKKLRSEIIDELNELTQKEKTDQDKSESKASKSAKTINSPKNLNPDPRFYDKTANGVPKTSGESNFDPRFYGKTANGVPKTADNSNFDNLTFSMIASLLATITVCAYILLSSRTKKKINNFDF
ncbi:MAG: hypothetical protein LBH37_02250 [Oscillospiraceae bacterium]|jgi:hypothetical protein|nr:hypothetical protein [Oscillospiraceae bacterium]